MLKSQISRTGFDGKQKIKNISKVIITAISVTVVVFLSVYSCKDKIIDPIEDQRPKPGRRDYVWTVDTLSKQTVYLERIWGANQQNVWAIGPNGGYSSSIWYYDGGEWLPTRIHFPLSPTAIYGFSKENVWIADDFGKIAHFNGNVWINKYEAGDQVSFNDIWGDYPNNIWAIGSELNNGKRSSILYNFDGNNWNRKNIPHFPGAFMRIKRGIKSSPDYFILNWIYDDVSDDSVKILRYNGKEFSTIYARNFDDGWRSSVQNINGEMVIGFEDVVYNWKKNNLIKIFEYSFSNSLGQIYGRNKNDIFLIMSDGVSHFNGSNQKYIIQIEANIRSTDCYVLGNEIFYLTRDLSKGANIIYKGILK